MKSLGKFLDKKYGSSAKKMVVDEKTILFLTGKFLEEEYGRRGATQLLPKYFREGRLILLARSSLWASEARNDAKRIQTSLNRTLEGEIITEIRIKHEFSG